MSGVGNRRLGERAVNVDPATMQSLATMTAQEAVRHGNAQYATAVGQEMGLAAAAAHTVDDAVHLAAGEMPRRRDGAGVRLQRRRLAAHGHGLSQ